MRRARMRLLATAVVGAVLLAGCAADPTRGYSSLSTFPADIGTVAVPIFANDTFNRDMEYQVTDALIKEIEARTPYKVTAGARADTILLGHIRSVELDQLSKSRLTGLSEEVIVSVSIDFEWKDLRTDRVILARRSFSGHGLFVPSNPSGEPIELGQFNVAQGLARDIVAEMRSGW